MSHFGSHPSIQKWLEARQTLLVSYYKLCEMKPQSYTELTQERLNDFSSQLVDYVSAGHFEVFEMISAECPEGVPGKLIVACLRYTNQCLDFVDQYADTKDYSQLQTALSEVGLLMESRFECEDTIIQQFYSQKKRAP